MDEFVLVVGLLAQHLEAHISSSVTCALGGSARAVGEWSGDL
jgi:hypothetical protein